MSLSLSKAKEVPYKKFYLAGALMRMLCGDPTWVVAERFKIPRGTLQSALQAANSHASKLSQFTKVSYNCNFPSGI